MKHTIDSSFERETGGWVLKAEAEIEADLFTNSRHPVLSFSSELFWARETRKRGAVEGRFERWSAEPGAVSQLWQRYAGLLLCPWSQVSYPYTSMHTCNDPLSVCLFGPCQTVYNISPLQESASDEQMLCMDSRRWRRQCKVTLPDKYGSRPLLHHEAVKPTGPSHLGWSLSDMPGPTLTQVHDFTLQHTTNLFNFEVQRLAWVQIDIYVAKASSTLPKRH